MKIQMVSISGVVMVFRLGGLNLLLVKIFEGAELIFSPFITTVSNFWGG